KAGSANSASRGSTFFNTLHLKVEWQRILSDSLKSLRRRYPDQVRRVLSQRTSVMQHPVENGAIVMIWRILRKCYGSGGANQADLKSNQPSVFILNPRILRWPWIISQWWI